MIIRQGSQYEVSVRLSDERHKYGSALAEYVDYSRELDYSGDVECPTGAYAIIGRRLMRNDSRGFVDVETYGDVRGARQVFDALELAYSVWEADEDGDEDEYRYVSSDDAAAFVSYVLQCAHENLESYDYDTWAIFGRPTGP